MRRSRVIAVTAAVVVAILGAGAWSVVRNQERSVEQTVVDYFEARRDGDCGRLFDLVSDPDTRWDRDDFVDRCADVVDEFAPELDEVEVLSTGDDHAVVSLSIALDDPPAPFSRPDGDGIVVTGTEEDGRPAGRLYQEGRLVREGGDWTVETDLGLLRLGRSAEDTVRSYIASYNDGDCEGQIDLLSESAWSQDGLLTRQQYLDRCAQAVTDRAELPLPLPGAATGGIWIGDPQAIEVTVDQDRRGVATAHLAPPPDQLPSDTATLVRDGLRWRLDDRLEAVAYLELGMALAPEPLPGLPLESITDVYPGTLASPDSVEGGDSAERRGEAGFQRGVSGDFQRDSEGTYITGDLGVYEFAANEGATAYATQLGTRIPTRPGFTALDTLPAGAVGGGIRTYCEDDGCDHANQAALVAVHGDKVVVVAVFYSRDTPDQTPAEVLTQATQVLQTQLARL